MANYTENYNFVLPEESDIYDVQDYNENFSVLDTALASIEEQVEASANTPNSVIKSIQHVIFQVPTGCTSSTCSINPVDTTKTFVIFERLEDSNCRNVEYSLEDSQISLTHGSYGSAVVVLIGFWIIEFN